MQFDKVYLFKSSKALYGIRDNQVWFYSNYLQVWCRSDVAATAPVKFGATLVAKNVVVKCTNPN